MNTSNLFFRFGISLAIGILVGMQREFAKENQGQDLAAGIRTFGLLSLSGCAAALLSDLLHSALPFIGITIITGLFFAINYYVDAKNGKIGLTTKMALVLTFMAGGLAYWPYTSTIAIALAVTTTVLLSVKVQLHRFVQHLTIEDMYATLKFAVITAIILPILPNKTFGIPPFDIFNPLKLWLFVVFISGISFIGYILIKMIGSKKGIELTGLLGGLASSTAVTASFTGKSKVNPELYRPFALAIIVAWTVMFVRVLVVVAVINPALVKPILIPIIGAIIIGIGYSAYLWEAERTDRQHHEIPFSNPFELGLAIKFGILFAAILFFTRATQIYFGNTGVYVSSFFSGLADVDAIAFSMAKLSNGIGGIDHTIAARAIVLASVANTIFKSGIVMMSGSNKLKKAILPGSILMIVASISLMFFV